jgi:hypothetical protein
MKSRFPNLVEPLSSYKNLYARALPSADHLICPVGPANGKSNQTGVIRLPSAFLSYLSLSSVHHTSLGARNIRGRTL